MYTGNISRARLITFCLVIGAATAGCNVDGVRTAWPFGKAPTTPSARDDRSAETVDLSIVDAREVDVVEAVVANREAYRRGLEELRAYYESHGYATKEAWAAFELEGLGRVKQFRYLMDAEIPSSALRPTDSIEEADALYNKGLDLMRRGGHGVPVLYRQNLMIQAAEVFRNLIVQYPTSDKIDDAAFFCGEIHKEYLPDQAPLAVKWYERAWTWNPQTPQAPYGTYLR